MRVVVVPLEVHWGTLEDPVVQFTVTIDLLYLVVLALLLVLVLLRWGPGVLATDRGAIPVSVAAITGVALTVAFAFPLTPVPGGAFFRHVWPGFSHPVFVVLLGSLPGLIGMVALWRIRTELRGGDPA